MRGELLGTILWLRWKLSRNQIRKSGRFIQGLVLVLTVLACVGVVGVVIGGYFVGSRPLSRAPFQAVMYVADGVMIGFLFFWMIGILAEIQRSESIDLHKLLHLPVTLKDAFVVNFIASHVNLVVALVLPFVTGLSFGLMRGRDPALLVLLPLFLAFLFFISAWTYCLRGWLVQLMVNPRRRRTIIITLTMTVVLAGQLPNLFFNVFNRHSAKGGNSGEAMRQRMSQMKVVVDRLHYFLPPLWVGWGARRAAEGTWWPALGAVAVCVAGGSAGLARAYRSTLRFYRGAGNAKPVVKAVEQPHPPTTVARPLEGRLPFVPDDVSGAALAFLRSMIRAPELKMALLGPIMMLGVLVVILMGRDAGEGLRRAAPLAAIGMTVFSFTGILQVAFNQFGWDRTGFRALVLLPTRRSAVLLAKNLAAGSLMLGLGLLVYAGVAFFLRVPLLEAMAGSFQVLAAVVMLCAGGNYLSIVMPVRMSAGSLKPTKMPVATALLMMLLTLLLPVYMIPVLIGPALGLLANLAGSTWSGVVNLGCSVVVLVVVVALYSVTLRPLGRLLWEREQRILDTVTAEVE